jgi:hypothetical protein
MRRLISWISLLFFSVTVFGQSQPTERSTIENLLNRQFVKATNQVGDFTITDTDGNTWNLYQQLDAGKTVFLDLFFST